MLVEITKKLTDMKQIDPYDNLAKSIQDKEKQKNIKISSINMCGVSKALPENSCGQTRMKKDEIEHRGLTSDYALKPATDLGLSKEWTI